MWSLLLTLAALSPLSSVHAAPTTSGKFTILSFNVAGLPSILNSNDESGDKTTNTMEIGEYFSEYNFSLIHVQEDFNYHATLYEYDDHPYRTATSGGAGIGSGLNTLANFDWVDFTRTKWDECSDASEYDCLTPKGFTFMRVWVSEGVWIDAYNLHADAGTEDADNEARANNLEQVSYYIGNYSFGNPVLVFGDSNSRYTRASDVPGIFASNNNMTDVWVELIRDGVPPTAGADALLCDNPSNTTACEVVDKVWYRGSPLIDLQATEFQYVGDLFLSSNGSTLSDHDPILVNFTWSLSDTLRMTDYYGGPHGDYYTDVTNLTDISSPTVSSITLRGANRLDALSIVLSSGQNFTHGGTGGSPVSLTLEDGETLVQAGLCQGEYEDHTRIFYANVTTSSGRTIEAGTTTDECVIRDIEDGWAIVGAVGRSGDEVDRVAFVYAK